MRKWLGASDTMILYDGTAIVEQNLTDQVTILNSTNDSVTLSIDPRSHLPVRKIYSYRDPLDRQLDDESEIFSNYRLVQGIQTPYSVVRHHNGEMSSQRFITSVTYNNGFPPTMFEASGPHLQSAQEWGEEVAGYMPADFDEQAARRFVNLALACVHREYPNKIAHILSSDADVLPPRKLTPAFYGCFDWHSSVHGHWLLARLTAKLS